VVFILAETLVAKTSKNFQLFQYQSFQDLAKKNKDVPDRKPKVIVITYI
jgi:hypothetical protein